MKTVTNTTKTETSQANFPSADLINFRFDQNDKAMVKLDQKLDSIFCQIVTPKEMADAKAEALIIHIGITSRLNKLEGWNEWAVRIVFGSIFLSVLALIGVHYSLIK